MVESAVNMISSYSDEGQIKAKRNTIINIYRRDDGSEFEYIATQNRIEDDRELRVGERIELEFPGFKMAVIVISNDEEDNVLDDLEESRTFRYGDRQGENILYRNGLAYYDYFYRGYQFEFHPRYVKGMRDEYFDVYRIPRLSKTQKSEEA